MIFCVIIIAIFGNNSCVLVIIITIFGNNFYISSAFFNFQYLLPKIVIIFRNVRFFLVRVKIVITIFGNNYYQKL